MPYNFELAESLTEPPIKRAAYSDRTAWLMAVMSALAYVRIEQPTPLGELAKKLTKEENTRTILSKLKALLSGEDRDQLKKEFDSDLKDLGFDIINNYNVPIPFVVDTQAFLAKLTMKNRDPILVLAFRGTEPNKPADIRSDVTANPVDIGPKEGGQKVHKGFLQAFRVAQKLIEKDLQKPDLKGIPLYITGHSLGGALAIVATYCISNDSLGACYTFGGPRVGNLAFGQSIRTPIYRVVNAADMVPRLPPSYAIEGLTLLLRWLPVIPYNTKIADFLEKFRHARHYGDLRYLTAANKSAVDLDGGGTIAEYPGLEVIANPPQLSRWIWLYRRLIATMGRAGFQDHSIDIYVEKLAYWGVLRARPSKVPTSKAEEVKDEAV